VINSTCSVNTEWKEILVLGEHHEPPQMTVPIVIYYVYTHIRREGRIHSLYINKPKSDALHNSLLILIIMENVGIAVLTITSTTVSTKN